MLSAHERSRDHWWILNGKTLGSAGVAWKPKKGKHLLTLVDREGKILDSVSIEVRESEPSER